MPGCPGWRCKGYSWKQWLVAYFVYRVRRGLPGMVLSTIRVLITSDPFVRFKNWLIKYSSLISWSEKRLFTWRWSALERTREPMNGVGSHMINARIMCFSLMRLRPIVCCYLGEVPRRDRAQCREYRSALTPRLWIYLVANSSTKSSFSRLQVSEGPGMESQWVLDLLWMATGRYTNIQHS